MKGRAGGWSAISRIIFAPGAREDGDVAHGVDNPDHLIARVRDVDIAIGIGGHALGLAELRRCGRAGKWSKRAAILAPVIEAVARKGVDLARGIDDANHLVQLVGDVEVPGGVEGKGPRHVESGCGSG